MRAPPLLCLLTLLWAAAPATAQTPASPRVLGSFQDWTAAAYEEGGQRICYAFTRAHRSEGPGPRRAEEAQLMVTHRPDGRDQVALRLGYPIPRGAELRLAVGAAEFAAYTHQGSAFLRDGRAAVAAMRAQRQALARAPGQGGRAAVQLVFSLSGFSAAYDAISRACPTTAARR
ncbi:MAG: hypothetical protein RMK64_09945 [Rhodovarius sp.]|nr:hypothetical protein [Rhodovarius sp.]MDW8315279.1 hypothetical protein [Rhodovarius sp.]